MVSLAVLIWIILLAGGLRCFLGAELSTGWLVIGLMATAAGLGFLLLVKEFMDALTEPGPLGHSRPRAAGFWKTSGTHAKSGLAGVRRLIDPMGAQRCRSALGLPPREVHCNRRRQQASPAGFFRRWRQQHS
jgi:hypothetical protein